jgi:hypothetical protein
MQWSEDARKHKWPFDHPLLQLLPPTICFVHSSDHLCDIYINQSFVLCNDPSSMFTSITEKLFHGGTGQNYLWFQSTEFQSCIYQIILQNISCVHKQVDHQTRFLEVKFLGVRGYGPSKIHMLKSSPPCLRPWLYLEIQMLKMKVVKMRSLERVFKKTFIDIKLYKRVSLRNIHTYI